MTRQEMWEKMARKDELIDGFVREAGGSESRLIALAQAAGLRADGTETWYTAAEYLAEREIERRDRLALEASAEPDDEEPRLSL